MIDYRQLAEKHAKLETGKHLILKVSGMVSPGKDRDGEPLPLPVANDTLVKVTKVHADSVDVVTQAGKKLTFGHLHGANRLELTGHADWPKPEAPAK
jgi:hypothetical protein